MRYANPLPALAAFGLLSLAGSAADAQVVTTEVSEPVVVSAPPPIVLDNGAVIKERRRLFRPWERVYVVKNRPRRISVPATVTTSTIESLPSRRTTTIGSSSTTIIEPPATIIGKPSEIIESPAKLDEDSTPALNLEKPEGEVRYLKPASAPANAPAPIIRSTPRGG